MGLLDKLTRIKKGERPADVFTEERVNGWLEVLEACLRGKNVKALRDLNVDEGTDGWTLSKKLGGGGGEESAPHPWQISFRKNPEDPLLYQAKVEIDSDLLKSLQPDDRQIVTGLGEWFDLNPDDCIWLEVSIAEFSVVDATIKSWGQGFADLDPTAAAWTENGFVEASDNEDPLSNQSVLRVMLGYFLAHEVSGVPVLHQSAFNHFLLDLRTITARPALVAEPTAYRAYVL